MNGRTPIGVELVRRGVVKETDIATAIEYQKQHPEKKLGDILNILNLCPQKKLIDAMGEILGENVIILTTDDVKIRENKYLPLNISKACKAILFEVIGRRAKVCFADTSNNKAIEEVRLSLLKNGLVMEKFLTFETNIENVLQSLEKKEEATIVSAGDITKLVDTIIRSAMEKRASDIHIEPLENEINSLKDEQRRINLIIENEIRSDIKLLAENYLPAAKRYEKTTARIEAMQADIDVMKSVIREHSEKLQKIS